MGHKTDVGCLGQKEGEAGQQRKEKEKEENERRRQGTRAKRRGDFSEEGDREKLKGGGW